jgi:adenosylcobyric acid synthase
MSARELMVQGTASGVGKSLLTAALCRILVRTGLRVLPFKAQNMSNNAAVTVSGGEIGRAQALQAQAARVEPDVRMNPILLKPLADTQCDVVVLGRSRPELQALQWHARRDVLWPFVTRSLDALRADADVIVIEGAGSPAETNLRHSDIVNMAVAQHAQAAVLLVADIDQGGAFASLYGTWSLLEPADRALIQGFILNKFRGDAALLHPAPAELQQRTGARVIGTVPHLGHNLPDEDAFTMRSGAAGAVKIAAIRLPHIANFDDLDPLAQEPSVHVLWTDTPAQVLSAQAIVIPGTRNTLADLRWLWESGLAAVIRSRAQAGVPVIGLCGGYQMLGDQVRDAEGIEAGGSCPGLALLSLTTDFRPHKYTQRTRALATTLPFAPHSASAMELQGYEIHHGQSEVRAPAQSWLLRDGETIGAVSGPVWGSYLHGLFANDAFRRAWLESLNVAGVVHNWSARIEQELDRLADNVAAALDLDFIDALLAAQPA